MTSSPTQYVGGSLLCKWRSVPRDIGKGQPRYATKTSSAPISAYKQSFRRSPGRAGVLTQALADYRTSLHQLLDSERWEHHRTMQALKVEVSRRQQLEQHSKHVKTEYQGLSNGLAYTAY